VSPSCTSVVTASASVVSVANVAPRLPRLLGFFVAPPLVYAMRTKVLQTR
jgi:hypothetical protein